MTRDVVIGIGSNLGDRERHLRTAVARVAALDGVTLVATSTFKETAPVGPPQPMFMNGAIRIHTTLEPHALLRELQAIEAAGGRERSRETRFGPRTIDLDILWIANEPIASPDLTVPHPRLHERAFALDPLCELLGQLPTELLQAQPPAHS